ncbi:MAG: hypothetical protein RIQ59_1124 [Bacteroidota bacterium]|jgi:hypothetical protein
MKKIKILKFTFLLMLMNSFSLLAQDPTGFNDDVVDNAPVAPIDNWIPFILFSAIIFAYKITSKKSNQTIN